MGQGRAHRMAIAAVATTGRRLQRVRVSKRARGSERESLPTGVWECPQIKIEHPANEIKSECVIPRHDTNQGAGPGARARPKRTCSRLKHAHARERRTFHPARRSSPRVTPASLVLTSQDCTFDKKGAVFSCCANNVSDADEKAPGHQFDKQRGRQTVSRTKVMNNRSRGWL
jgi:hypothetical protein